MHYGRRARDAGLASLALAAALVALPAASRSAPDTFAGRNGQIAFSRSGASGSELYLMRPDGKRQRRLLRGGAGPSWSRDGKRLAFERLRQAPEGLAILTLAGRRVRTLTRQEDARARWAPDGKRILFQRRDPQSSVSALYLIGAKGKGLRKLADQGFDAAWTPSASSIVFASPPGGQADLFTMRPDGRGKRRITQGPDADLQPDVSPNGRKIAFVRRHENNYDIYVVPTGGGSERRLTSATGQDLNPSWSPDGKRIAFACERSPGRFSICVMQANGTRQRKLTASAGNDFEPAWQPLPRARR